MPHEIACRTTPRLTGKFPGMLFGAVIAAQVDVQAFDKAVHEFAARVAGDLQHLSEDVQRNLEAFESFFARYGQRCPLRSQISKAAEQGFSSSIPAPILALLALEASTGVLMGVQDMDAMCDYLELDVLPAPQSFLGMSGKTVNCLAGEVVVRDSLDIVASLLRGPDSRTAVSTSYVNLLFYVFDAYPSLGAGHTVAAEAVASLASQGAMKTAVLQLCAAQACAVTAADDLSQRRNG
jgi:hypothetical protein